MEKATDAQTALLKKLGVTFDYNMSKQEASKLIEETLKAQKKPKDTIESKPAYEPQKQFDATSSYVAYAKDLCIAIIEAIRKKHEDKEIEVDKVMETAIHCIHMAKNEFQK